MEHIVGNGTCASHVYSNVVIAAKLLQNIGGDGAASVSPKNLMVLRNYIYIIIAE